MTMPAPETIEREKEKLYVTDAELIRRAHRLRAPRPHRKIVGRSITCRYSAEILTVIRWSTGCIGVQDGADLHPRSSGALVL